MCIERWLNTQWLRKAISWISGINIDTILALQPSKPSQHFYFTYQIVPHWCNMDTTVIQPPKWLQLCFKMGKNGVFWLIFLSQWYSWGHINEWNWILKLSCIQYYPFITRKLWVSIITPVISQENPCVHSNQLFHHITHDLYSIQLKTLTVLVYAIQWNTKPSANDNQRFKPTILPRHINALNTISCGQHQ